MGARHRALGRIDNATAKRLLREHMRIVFALRRLYAYVDHADFRAAGEDAILEGFLSYDAGRGLTETSWIRRVIHWRIAELAQSTVRERELDARSEPLGTDPQLLNGADPEQQFWRATAVRAIALLPVRQQMVIEGEMRGYTCAEIGEQIGVCRALAHADGQRARKKLRSILEDGDVTPAEDTPD